MFLVENTMVCVKEKGIYESRQMMVHIVADSGMHRHTEVGRSVLLDKMMENAWWVEMGVCLRPLR